MEKFIELNEADLSDVAGGEWTQEQIDAALGAFRPRPTGAGGIQD